MSDAQDDMIEIIGDCPRCGAMVLASRLPGRDIVVFAHGVVSDSELKMSVDEYDRIDGTPEFFAKLDSWIDEIHNMVRDEGDE